MTKQDKQWNLLLVLLMINFVAADVGWYCIFLLPFFWIPSK